MSPRPPRPVAVGPVAVETPQPFPHAGVRVEPGTTVVKEGYVWKYRIYLLRKPSRRDAYFTVTISDSADHEVNPAEFVMQRDEISEEVDQNADKKFWAVSFSSISMAIIATLKDAFISKKKVRVYTVYPGPEIRSVEIGER